MYLSPTTELMNRVERSCEVRASRAVTTSTPYQSRCRTLSSARKESNRKFQVLMITNNRESEEQASVHTKMRKVRFFTSFRHLYHIT